MSVVFWTVKFEYKVNKTEAIKQSCINRRSTINADKMPYGGFLCLVIIFTEAVISILKKTALDNKETKIVFVWCAEVCICCVLNSHCSLTIG